MSNVINFTEPIAETGIEMSFSITGLDKITPEARVDAIQDLVFLMKHNASNRLALAPIIEDRWKKEGADCRITATGDWRRHEINFLLWMLRKGYNIGRDTYTKVWKIEVPNE